MVKIIDFEKELTAEDLLSYLPGDSADLYEDDAEDLMDQVRDADALHPGACYEAVQISSKEGNSICFDSIRITSSLFEKYLKAGDRVYACMSTVGRQLDAFAHTLDDPMLSYLQGTLMNICLDDGILWAAGELAKENPGKKLMMLKPGIEGVCEFTEQAAIVALLQDGPDALDVEVKENGFLSPAYSCTALLFTVDEESNMLSDWTDREAGRKLMHELNVIAGHI